MNSKGWKDMHRFGSYYINVGCLNYHFSLLFDGYQKWYCYTSVHWGIWFSLPINNASTFNNEWTTVFTFGELNGKNTKVSHECSWWKGYSCEYPPVVKRYIYSYQIIRDRNRIARIVIGMITDTSQMPVRKWSYPNRRFSLRVTIKRLTPPYDKHWKKLTSIKSQLCFFYLTLEGNEVLSLVFRPIRFT